MILGIAITEIFPGAFATLFNAGQSREFFIEVMRIISVSFSFAGINILLVAYFSATANARPAIIGSLMRGAIAIVLCAIVLSRILGMNGVWLSFLASEMLTFVVILILSGKKERTADDYI